MNEIILMRKLKKSKSIFSTNNSIRKGVYMSVFEISKKWTMHVCYRAHAYAQLSIFFRTNWQHDKSVIESHFPEV